MHNARRGTFQRGTSILAALVFVAILSSIAYAVHSIAPDSRAQSAAVLLAGADAVPSIAPPDTFVPKKTGVSAGIASLNKAKLSGADRCNAPIKIQQGNSNVKLDAEALSKDVINVCVPGCFYEVTQTELGTLVKANDLCAGKSGDALKSCVAGDVPCQVEHCDIMGDCKTVTPGDPNGANNFLSSTLGIPPTVKIQADPDVQAVLRKALTNPGDAQTDLEKLPPYKQQAFTTGQKNVIDSGLPAILDLVGNDDKAAAQSDIENLKRVSVNKNIETDVTTLPAPPTCANDPQYCQKNQPAGQTDANAPQQGGSTFTPSASTGQSDEEYSRERMRGEKSAADASQKGPAIPSAGRNWTGEGDTVQPAERAPDNRSGGVNGGVSTEPASGSDEAEPATMYEKALQEKIASERAFCKESGGLFLGCKVIGGQRCEQGIFSAKCEDIALSDREIADLKTSTQQVNDQLAQNAGDTAPPSPTNKDFVSSTYTCSGSLCTAEPSNLGEQKQLEDVGFRCYTVETGTYCDKPATPAESGIANAPESGTPQPDQSSPAEVPKDNYGAPCNSPKADPGSCPQGWQPPTPSSPSSNPCPEGYAVDADGNCARFVLPAIKDGTPVDRIADNNGQCYAGGLTESQKLYLTNRCYSCAVTEGGYACSRADGGSAVNCGTVEPTCASVPSPKKEVIGPAPTRDVPETGGAPETAKPESTRQGPCPDGSVVRADGSCPESKKVPDSKWTPATPLEQAKLNEVNGNTPEQAALQDKIDATKLACKKEFSHCYVNVQNQKCRSGWENVVGQPWGTNCQNITVNAQEVDAYRNSLNPEATVPGTATVNESAPSPAPTPTLDQIKAAQQACAGSGMQCEVRGNQVCTFDDDRNETCKNITTAGPLPQLVNPRGGPVLPQDVPFSCSGTLCTAVPPTEAGQKYLESQGYRCINGETGRYCSKETVDTVNPDRTAGPPQGAPQLPANQPTTGGSSPYITPAEGTCPDGTPVQQNGSCTDAQKVVTKSPPTTTTTPPPSQTPPPPPDDTHPYKCIVSINPLVTQDVQVGANNPLPAYCLNGKVNPNTQNTQNTGWSTKGFLNDTLSGFVAGGTIGLLGRSILGPANSGNSNPYPYYQQPAPASPGTPSTPQQPTATISCSPLMADDTMQVTITYSCANSARSNGRNFLTGGKLSDTVSTALPPLEGDAGSITFGVECTNAQGQSAVQECAVQVSHPSITLVTNPPQVASGKQATIGWATTGMKACTISSPDSPDFTAQNAGFTAVSGNAKTPNLTNPMSFVLTCATLGGQTKTATTTVTVK